MPRRQQRTRPPAAHAHPGTPADPNDITLPVDVRLVAARTILTQHVRATCQQEARAAALLHATEDSLELPDAPHKLWAEELARISNTQDEDEEAGEDDDEQVSLEWEFAGPELTDRADPHSGKTNRFHPANWPPGTAFGDDDWIQLRWRPWWYLDQGQRWMDRFQLGQNWWQAIYSDSRFNTEGKFETWRKKPENWCRGVIWAAPTPDGRLDEPALAVVVVAATRRPRRTATWTLFLPDPTWPPKAQQWYVDQRLAGNDGWPRLAVDAMAIEDPGNAAQQLAGDRLRDRFAARRRRGC